MTKHLLHYPPVNNSFYDSEIRFELPDNTLFVYGSNAAGRHGKGAALDALHNHGAKYGIGLGLQGSSYAIPTKDRNLRVLDFRQVAFYVADFIEFTKEHPEYSYFVTAVGTGLAGFPHFSMAPLFKNINNAWLPDRWKPYLKKT